MSVRTKTTSPDLSSTSTWSSSVPAVASVGSGPVLGLVMGTTNITPTNTGFNAVTNLTVEPAVNITFSPVYDDGTIPSKLILAINSISSNADGTSTTSTPVLQLPDPISNSMTGTFFINPALTYSIVFQNGATVIDNPSTCPAVLILAMMPNISSACSNVTLFESRLIKGFDSGAH
jgi:hypothetical protein